MAKLDYRKILIEAETAVREGRVPQVKRLLVSLNGARLPRDLRLPFAGLARRTGLNNLGLRLLTPLVHGKNAGPAELAEYAVLLQRTGSLGEAFKILGGLDYGQEPRALLYLSFCHFNRWEYFEAVPLLRKYLDVPMPGYQKTVGQVNLAAALVANGELKEALDVLAGVSARARGEGLRRLEGNAHEIRAQAYFRSRDLKAARAEAVRAHDLLKSEGTVAALNARKWLAVVSAFEDRDPAPLRKFRAEAGTFGEWEAVRHADLCLLQLEFSPSLFDFHLFGTPWLGYRENAQRTLERVMTSAFFDFGKAGGARFDVAKALLDGRAAFPVGGKMHRVLSGLTSDFYRPLPVGALFSELFPGEHFDIFSSPNRVHQAVFRFRDWAGTAKLPLSIEHSPEGYRLRLTGPLRLTVPYERNVPEAHQEMFKAVAARSGGGVALSLREIAAMTGRPPSAARRFCRWALDKGLFTMSGAGPSTRYHLKTVSPFQIKTA